MRWRPLTTLVSNEQLACAASRCTGALLLELPFTSCRQQTRRSSSMMRSVGRSSAVALFQHTAALAAETRMKFILVSAAMS